MNNYLGIGPRDVKIKWIGKFACGVVSALIALGALNAFAAGTPVAQRPVFLNYDETHYAHSRIKMGDVLLRARSAVSLANTKARM